MNDPLKTLEAQLAAAPDESTQIDALNALAWKLRERDPHRALSLAQTAYKLAQQSRYQAGQARSLHVLGFYHNDEGYFEQALTELLEAKTLFDTLGQVQGQAGVLCSLGAVQSSMGNHAEALEYYLQALHLAETIEDKPSQAMAFNGIANFYGNQGDHNQALSVYEKALAILQELGDQRGQAMMLNNMAVDYYQVANYPQALACGLTSLELAQETGNKNLEVYIHNTLGETYLEMGQYQPAIEAFQHGLTLNQPLASKKNEQFILYYLGLAHYRRQEVEPALAYLQQALLLAQEIEAKTELYQCHQLLAEIYENQGQFEVALAHYRQYHQVYQTVFNDKSDKKLKKLEVRYRTDTAQKEAEIHRLRNDELEKEITERKLAEATAQRRANQLLALVEVGREISATLNLTGVLERIASRAKELLRGTDAAVYMLQPDGVTLKVIIAVSEYAQELKGRPLSLGQGIIGHIAQSGLAEIINQPAQDPRLIRLVGPWDEKFGSDDNLFPFMAAPITVSDAHIGVIAVWRYIKTGFFNSANLYFLDALAQQAAIAIQNARLFEAEQHQRQLAEERSQALEAANTALLTTNAELDAFSHTVAHDLKNPLGVIISFSEFLSLNEVDISPTELQSILRSLYNSAFKAVDIVDELLLLASVRKGEVELTPFDMKTVAETALERLQNLAEQYQGEVILPLNWPDALGYGPWVEEVWVNYLSNGLKYGGQPPRLKLGGTQQPDGMVRFWVQDNGPGLTPAEQARLFTEFTRLDQVRTEGHGLGLSIVRRIIEKLGGQVGVESAGIPGQGSTFYFTLTGA